MNGFASADAQWLGLAVALGAGLLIGLEREQGKRRGRNRDHAGIRTFAVAAFTGALAHSLGNPALVIAGALLVGVLAAAMHWKTHGRDPSFTTELSLFTTYLVGVQSVDSPALGAACGAALAAVLAARERLHRFATQAMSEQELHDALLLAALILIVLPLMPAAPLPWLAGVSPRALVGLVVLILALQAVGHVALRWLGAAAGVAASGFFSGFVSSTATIASAGSRARATPGQSLLQAAGGVLSSAATWVQAMLIAAAMAPAAALALLPIAAGGFGCALAAGSALLWAARRTPAAPAPAPAQRAPRTSALRVREAVIVALLLTGVTLGVGWAERRFGDSGALTGAALAALADAHAPIASLAALYAAGSVTTTTWLLGVLTAISANSATRAAVAQASGGARFAAAVTAALALQLGAAWALYLTR